MTSAVSPAWMRFTTPPSVANVTITLYPVARSNFGARFSITSCTPMALKNVSSAPAAPALARSKAMKPTLADAVFMMYLPWDCPCV